VNPRTLASVSGLWRDTLRVGLKTEARILETGLTPRRLSRADPADPLNRILYAYFVRSGRAVSCRARLQVSRAAQRHGCVQATSPSQSPKLRMTRSRVNEVRSDRRPALSSFIRVRCVPG
jgi:hypothetical protein